MIETTKMEIEQRYRIENGYEHDAKVRLLLELNNAPVKNKPI